MIGNIAYSCYLVDRILTETPISAAIETGDPASISSKHVSVANYRKRRQYRGKKRGNPGKNIQSVNSTLHITDY